MKRLGYACLLLALVSGCAKEKEPCAPGTLLLQVECEQGLGRVDSVVLQVTRAGEAGSTFTTNIICPDRKLFQVAVPNYLVGQTFVIVATPAIVGVPVVPPLTPVSVTLEPGCTRVVIPLVDVAPDAATLSPEVDASVAEVGTDGAVVEPASVLLGGACALAADCATGQCFDGVCCAQACEGTCFACNVEGMLGQCVPLPAGARPAVGKACREDPLASCGQDGMCDGAGACRTRPDGTVCAAGECLGAGTTNRKVCSGGSCSVTQDLVCAPFLCNPADVKCFAGCETAAQCEGEKPCEVDPDTSKKSCGKKLLGASCELNAECETGHCADGVCCSTACSGACVACNQAGHLGSCRSVAAGITDPRGVCMATPASECGHNGTCNGQGGCASFTVGTICSAPRCDGNSFVASGTCDGNGTCGAGGSFSCAPFRCENRMCKLECAKDEDCVGGATCLDGRCGKAGAGLACTAGDQCLSGFCVDDVCCESACDGTCQYCASASQPGRCIDVPAGSDDPRRKCAATAVSECGTTGKCNGSGACQLFAAGTECRGSSCDAAANKETFARQCDGLGACKELRADRVCAPFTCSGNACGTQCSRNDECVAPNTCVGTLCGKLANGQLCGNDASRCESGVCAQGVCCEAACTGLCRSCAVAGNEGKCVNVPVNQDPLNQCEAQAACGTTGACDGTGKCAVFAAGVTCAGPMCAMSGASWVGPSQCNGAGDCVPPAGMVCSNNLVCGGSIAACKLSCTGDGDCRNGTKCNLRTGQCAAANGAACGSNGVCGSDRCVDGFCCDKACDGTCEACSALLTGGVNGVCAPTKTGTADPACPAAGCSGNTATGATSCNGAGQCSTPTSTPCGGATPACLTGACVACTPGSMGTCGEKLGAQGSCAAGTTVCGAGGQWGACSVVAKADTCAVGNDDSCNGVVNEGCDCSGFPMPNPAGSGLPNPASYDTSVAGVVTDNVTGLMWESAASATNMTQAQATTYCAGRNTGGFGGWRAPKRLELVSLVNHTIMDPSIDKNAFPQTPLALFWSSTPYAPEDGRGWAVNFSFGPTRSQIQSQSFRVRCVRRAKPIGCFGQRFVSVAEPGVSAARDQSTGLIWQLNNTQTSGSSTWAAAKEHCKNLAPGFRLPTITELQSIVNDASSGMAIDTSVFSDVNQLCNWSATVNPDLFDPFEEKQPIWTVWFGTGSADTLILENEACAARCVK